MQGKEVLRRSSARKVGVQAEDFNKDITTGKRKTSTIAKNSAQKLSKIVQTVLKRKGGASSSKSVPSKKRKVERRDVKASKLDCSPYKNRVVDITTPLTAKQKTILEWVFNSTDMRL